MSERPKKPTDEFLRRVRIASIPEQVDVVYIDQFHTGRTRIEISELDTKGALKRQAQVPFTGKSNDDLKATLHATLVDFGAEPIAAHA